MLGAHLSSRYWDQLARRYQKRDEWARIFLAVMTCSTVAAWASTNLPVLWQGLSIVSAALAVALPILDWNGKVEVMVEQRTEWGALRIEYEDLWSDVSGATETSSELRKRYHDLRKREIRTESGSAKLPQDDDLIESCALEVLRNRGLADPRRTS